ncbi:hypothetical protein RJT34_12090 [Clitoria ternatea]|uniref:Uncharacterized protein n=1 Tax=Clitoria ternatea TaxID=43366 RepID=A0AAN9JN55_CLITE
MLSSTPHIANTIANLPPFSIPYPLSRSLASHHFHPNKVSSGDGIRDVLIVEEDGVQRIREDVLRGPL